MKQLKYLVCFLFLLCISNSITAQLTSSKYKADFKLDKYRPLILKAFAKNNNLQKRMIVIKGTPNQTFDTSRNFSICALSKIIIDFSRKNQITNVTISEPESLIILPNNDAAVYEYEIKDSSIALLGENRSLNYRTGFSSQSNTATNFFYILDSDKYLGNDAIFSQPDNIQFINCFNGNKFTNFSDFINAKFGSLSKLFSLLVQEKKDKYLIKEAFKNFDVKKDAIGFIKKSIKFRCIFLPKDTIGNLQCLINDIKQNIQIEPKQIDQLKKGVQDMVIIKEDPSLSFDTLNKYPNRMQTYLEELKSKPTVSFMNRNIYPVLSSVLNRDQLLQYYDQTKIETLQFHRIDQYIYHTYLNQTYPTIEAKSEAYKNYIISILKNSN